MQAGAHVTVGEEREVADASPVSPQERTRQTERTLLGGDPLALVSGELLRTVGVPFYRCSPTDIRKIPWVSMLTGIASSHVLNRSAVSGDSIL